MQLQHPQPEQQLFKKAPLGHALGKVIAGSTDDTHIHLHLLGLPNPVKAAIFEHPQQLALQQRRHLRHLIEQEGATADLLQQASLARPFTAKGPRGRAKQLMLGHLIGQRRTIEG